MAITNINFKANIQENTHDLVVSNKKNIKGSVAYNIDVPTDSAGYTMVQKVGGMTRKCTNLMPYPYHSTSGNINGVNVTVNSDQSITISGTPTAFSQFRIFNGNLKLSQDSTISAKGLSSGSLGIVLLVDGVEKYLSEDKDSLLLPAGSTITIVNINIGASHAGTHTIYFTLNEGATALPYEPYFEGLRSAKVTEVKSVGANLLDESMLLKSPYITVSDTEYIARAGVYEIDTGINYKPNTRYTLAYTGKNDSGAVRLEFYYTDGTKSEFYFVSTEYKNLVFTTAENKTVKELCCYYGDGGSLYIKKGTIMIYEGADTKPYTPYVKHTLPIPAEVRPAHGINENVYDYIEWAEDGSVKKGVRCGVVDLGTLNWSYDSAFSRFSAIAPADIINKSYFENYSVCILGYNYKVYYDGDRTNGYCIDNGFIFARDLSYNDAASFKAAMQGVMLVYELAKPIVTDISDLITADNLIGVEGGGTLTFENEYEYNVPSMVQFYENTNELIGADEFVGDLTGTAKRAIADKEGRNIEQTYATKTEMNEKLAVSAKKTYSGIKYQEDVPNDVANYAAVQKVGGMTRKCTNLIHLKDYSRTVVGIPVSIKDGVVIAKGTATASGGRTNALTDVFLLQAGTYRFSYIGEVGGAFPYLNNQQTGKTIISATTLGSGFTLTEPTSVYFGINFTQDVAYDISFKLMLNEGTTAQPYEPYFEGLRSAAVTEVKSVGVNLLPISLLDNYTGSGVTITTNADGSATANGTATGDIFYTFAKDVLKPQTTYYISLGDGFIGNEKKEIVVLTVNSDGSNNYIKWSETPNFIVTMPAGFANSYIRIRGYAGAVFNNEIYYPFVAKSSVTVPYTPYVEHTLPIPEDVRPANGINENVYDYIEWAEDGSVKKTVKCGIVDLGTLDWEYSDRYGTGVMCFCTYDVANAKYVASSITPLILCPMYEAATATGMATGVEEGISMYDAVNQIIIRDTNYTDAATFKAAMQGVMLVYELAKPIVTDISDILPSKAIQVEDNGTLTFVNEFGYDVPYEVNFYDEIDEIVAANEFVGDLTGTASMAQCDATGRNIVDTYATKVGGRVDKAGMLERFQLVKYMDNSGEGYTEFARTPSNDIGSAIISIHTSTCTPNQDPYEGGGAALIHLCSDGMVPHKKYIKQIGGVNVAEHIFAKDDGSVIHFYIDNVFDYIGGDLPNISIISKTGTWEFGDFQQVSDVSNANRGQYLYLGDPSITEAQAKNLKTFAVGETITLSGVTDKPYFDIREVRLPFGIYIVTVYLSSHIPGYAGESYVFTGLMNFLNQEVGALSIGISFSPLLTCYYNLFDLKLGNIWLEGLDNYYDLNKDSVDITFHIRRIS